MAYSLRVSTTIALEDGLNGTQTVTVENQNITPTKPAFFGSGTATTTPAAVSYGSVTTPKAFLIVNDGANEITVDVGTDTFTLGISGSTSKLNWAIVSRFASAPEVSTASSTSAYRTFIME